MVGLIVEVQGDQERSDACNRAKARRRVAKIQERTANLRQEFLHQLSHFMVITWSVLCFEHLSLMALRRTKHAKSWLDAAFGELLRQVEYKARWNRQALCSGEPVLSVDQALFRMRL